MSTEALSAHSPGRPLTVSVAVLAARDGAACVWCQTSFALDTSHARVSTLIRSCDADPRAAENTLLACVDCDERRGHTPPAEWLLRCVDAGQAPDWAAVSAALERLHRSDKQLRRFTAEQSQMLESGRLPGERGQTGWRRRLIARDGNGCVWCAKPLAATDVDCTLEHILPRALAGPDTVANTMCACSACNNLRQDMRAGAWAQTCLGRGRPVRRDALHAVLTALSVTPGQTGQAARTELAVLAAAPRTRPRVARSATARSFRW